MEAEMEATSSAIGHMVIVVLYIAIGAMSAAGSAFIVRSILSAKWEQIFFGLFLIPIAGFYLAFAAYFGAKDAWQLEATAVAVFTAFGLLGTRVPFVLIIGYLLHGIWDAAHEFTLLAPQQATSVPLGYPYFARPMTSSWRDISTPAATIGTRPGAAILHGSLFRTESDETGAHPLAASSARQH
jgi:hypothetical protein